MQLFTFFNMGLNLCVHGNICLMMLGLLGLGGTWYMSCIGQDTLRICFMLISCWQAACQRIALHPAKKKQLSHVSGAKNLFQRLAVMIHDSRIDCCFACHKIARFCHQPATVSHHELESSASAMCVMSVVFSCSFLLWLHVWLECCTLCVESTLTRLGFREICYSPWLSPS